MQRRPAASELRTLAARSQRRASSTRVGLWQCSATQPQMSYTWVNKLHALAAGGAEGLHERMAEVAALALSLSLSLSVTQLQTILKVSCAPLLKEAQRLAMSAGSK